MSTTPTSFSNLKDLRFVITLGAGTFDGTDNQITIQGLRATVDIDLAGGSMYGHCTCNIWGVSQSLMNSITGYIYQPQQIPKNTILVFAIDGAQQTLIFEGNIITAWPNFQDPPEVFLQIQAQTALFNRLTPVPPSSYKGSVDVATVMGQLAALGGYTFENNGVSVQLSNLYLPGTMLDQAKELADTARINLYIANGVLAITPLNTPRATPQVPLISSASGMVGYPLYDGQVLIFKTFFNPAILFGGQIQVVLSSVPQTLSPNDKQLLTTIQTPQGAAGNWYVASVAHHLEAWKPGGQWFSTINARAIQIAVNSAAPVAS